MASIQAGDNIAVIGAGFGGLTAGLLLQRLGCRVTLVEKNRAAGGLSRGYTREGIRCPVGVHYLGALGEGEPLARMLGCLGVQSRLSWERMGQDGIVDRYLFDDFSFDLPEGLDAFAAALLAAFPEEKPAVSVFLDGLRGLAPWLLSPAFLNGDGTALLAPEHLETLDRRLETLRCSPRLRHVLSVPCFWLGLTAEDCPVAYHHTALLTYLFSSWRPAVAGAPLADVLAETFRERGGTLVLGDAAAEIPVQGGAAAGLVLCSGRRIQAQALVAAIHPKSLLALFPPAALNPVQSRRIRRLQDTDGIFAAHFAVDGQRHPPQGHNTFRIRVNGVHRMEEVLFCQLLPTAVPGTTLLSLLTGCGNDAWEAWKDTVSGCRGRDYEQAKRDKAFALLRRAEEVYGPFPEARLLDTFTRLTLRDWVGSPGGSAYGVRRSQSQLFPLGRLNRFPIGNLVLAGQNALAPGIFGTLLGSFHAVRLLVGRERFDREVVFR